MNYTYTSGVPAGAQTPAQQRGTLQTNNDNNALIWTVDHFGFNDNNGGWHQQVTIPNVQVAPTPSASAGVITTQTSNSKSELFYTNTTANVQLTNTSLTASIGEGFIPGGLQVRSGTASSNSAGIATTFSTPFPTDCVSVVLTGSNTSQTSNIMKVSSKSASGFVAKSPLGEAGYFIATGY